MTKITMPDPVAWEYRDDADIKHPGSGTRLISFVRQAGSNERQLVYSNQAEAYANSRVKQALEEAATICWEMQSRPEYGKDDKDRWLAIAEQRIRALIPKDET